MTTVDLTDMELTTSTIAHAPLIELETEPPTGLSVQMQTLAQGYIDARKRAGYAWLDMGRFLSEARAEAKYGEWSVFLEATNTSEDWAKRLIAIYTQSLQNRVFADAMRTNFLSVATGYELISAPPDVQVQLLNGDTPPTVKQIREEKREAANPAPSPTLGTAPPAPDLADILLRLDAHGYAKSGTRQKGITTFYSFRDFGSQLDEDQAGEIELPEGELPYWIQELDYKAARATERNAQYQDARDRFAALDWRLERDGMQFVLSSSAAGPKMRGTIDAMIKTLEGYERNAAKKAATQPTREAPPTLAELDALDMPVELHNAGYYWHSATPPTVAQNGSDWRGDAPTVDGAIAAARDREHAKAKEQLDASTYANALSLLASIRACLNASLRRDAAENTRRLLALLEMAA